MIRSAVSRGLPLAMALLAGCGSPVQTTPRTFPGESPDLAVGFESYYENRVEDAIPHFERAVDTHPDDADTRAWLAEVYRRTERYEEARVEALRALELDSCHNFALTILGNLYNPQYEGDRKHSNELLAWDQYEKAVECDPLDGNAWVPLWVLAMKREQLTVAATALTQMHAAGFWPPALVAHDRWMLENLPENAVFLVNGDADTFPTLILQLVEQLRTDVAVINLSLLNLRWYGRLMADIHRLPYPETVRAPHVGPDGEPVYISTQILRHWLERARRGELGRPVAIALTVDPQGYPDLSFEHRTLEGGYFLYANEAAEPVDVGSVRSSLEGIDIEDFAGPYTSQWDRSPVRHANSRHLADNPMAVALRCAEAALERGDREVAGEVLDWAERYRAHVDTSDRFGEQLESLREAQGR